MRKIDALSKPGFLVFLGQAAIFETVEEAERAATTWIEEGDIKYATIIPNVGAVTSAVMETALVIVNRGVTEMAPEGAIKEGYLDVNPEVGG